MFSPGENVDIASKLEGASFDMDERDKASRSTRSRAELEGKISEIVAFKIYVNQGVGHQEVRRFTVERIAVSDFDYLRSKIEKLVPAIRKRKYNVLWKDSDGDYVLIASNEELFIALTSMSELKTLYVNVSCEPSITKYSDSDSQCFCSSPQHNYQEREERPRSRLCRRQSFSSHEHSDDDAAISRVLLMGFKDDDGYITQLVKAKDGNIYSVLNVLIP